MKGWLPIVAVLILQIETMIADGPNSECVNELVRTAVESLGETILTDRGYREEFQLFARYPVDAACLLVNELNPISVHQISPESAERAPTELHVLWSLRALRYITGKKFTANTTLSFPESQSVRRTFLKKGNEGEVAFFAVWMSRDISYIAPIDAQEEIIRKWRSWYENHGAEFGYTDWSHIDHWYF